MRRRFTDLSFGPIRDICDDWRRMISPERVLLALLVLALIIVGVVVFAIAPNDIHEDDALVRIGVRPADELNTVEFALFVEVPQVGESTRIPTPSRYTPRRSSEWWQSGVVQLPPPARQVRVRVWRTSGVDEIELAELRVDGRWRPVGATQLLPSAAALAQLPPGDWLTLPTIHVRTHGEPLQALRLVWYVGFAVAAIATVLWWLMRHIR